MKLPIKNERRPGDASGDDALRGVFKWMNIRKGVRRFHSHEAADEWWKDHFLSAYDRAKDAGSADVIPIRKFLESQGLTPPE